MPDPCPLSQTASTPSAAPHQLVPASTGPCVKPHADVRLELGVCVCAIWQHVGELTGATGLNIRELPIGTCEASKTIPPFVDC